MGVVVNSIVSVGHDDTVDASVCVGDASDVVEGVCVRLITGLELSEFIVFGVFDAWTDCVDDEICVRDCSTDGDTITLGVFVGWTDNDG